MVHQVSLFKLKPGVPASKVEELMVSTRIHLLKIPEVLVVKCGKNLDPKSPWPFFIALEFESLDKRAVVEDDAIYLKFVTEVIKANTSDELTLSYEMEPGKDTRYS